MKVGRRIKGVLCNNLKQVRREAGSKNQIIKQQRRRQALKKQRQSYGIPALDDQWDKQKRCVLLLGEEAGIHDLSRAKLIAWYPETGEAGFISAIQLLMPPNFWPIDSCAGFVCGMHIEYEFSNWKFRVAVSNPATKYQVELPVLDISRLPAARKCAENEFSDGWLRLRMTPPQHEGELFCVHVTTSCNGVDTVYSFNTGLWCWQSSSFSGEPIGRHLVGDLLFRQRNVRSYDVGRRKWTAIAGPGDGQNWDADMPTFTSGYRRIFPFRYGEKIMAACTLVSYEFVLLELGGEGWKVVVSEEPQAFSSCMSFSKRCSQFSVEWPAVRGDLLLLPCFSRPVAFNLRNHIWMEIPPVLAESSLALNGGFVYEP